MHNFSDYLKKNEIKETGVVSNGDEALKLVLDYLKVLIAKERNILETAGEANDEGTIALISDYISGQEKTVWMITSMLS
jgi:starvation-inducible DNA-binding protein